ncbi:transaldolase [Halorhodospira halophila]|uniref:Transaldolase n=1 Tax=Halorhodospira halophila (strain DSM 244 / SL1) TaxID=349124 RepID=A1WWB1_HALHL|nr:transaldolase [Halorhodospira halophila]ABM61973.1 transaldolase [Halorhodospira halophila SL1]MBK1729699.1 transaldolase [Halorhodospira halophila]
MTENPLRGLAGVGQSVWYDNIHRGMLPAELERLVREDGLSGVTTNPAIFQKAIGGTEAYDEAITAAVQQVGRDPEAVFEALAMGDIRAAAQVLRPQYTQSDGLDGYVSMEVSPQLADDARGTVTEALRLYADAGEPNVMIKVPATPAGVEAFEELTVRGIPVNVTLIFGVERYRQVAEAYVRGLERRRQAGDSVAEPASVASLFISRLDAKIDPLLADSGSADVQPGQAAIANARVAYSVYREIFHGAPFAALAEAGARPQRLLWASTGVKGERYPETYYVEALAGPETVTTLPPATYEAYRRDGQPREQLTAQLEQAPAVLEALRAGGIDLDAILDELEREGIDAFVQAHRTLLDVLEKKLQAAAAT